MADPVSPYLNRPLRTEAQARAAIMHTPTPWAVNLPPVSGWPASNGDYRINIIGADGLSVGYVHQTRNPSTGGANASLIVKAVNCHAELLEALEKLAELGEQGMKPDYGEWLTFHDKVAQIARAAITRAKEG